MYGYTDRGIMDIEQFEQEILQAPQNYAYYGELDPETWGRLNFCGTHRDADALTRSNFEVIRDDLEDLFPAAVQVEESSHWLVGWSAVVRLDTTNREALQAAYDWYVALENYCVADDEHFSDTENEEVEERFDSYGQDEVVDWLREHGNPLGLLDDDGEPMPGLEHYLFRLFSDCHSYNGEFYVDDAAMEYSLREVRYEMRYEFERVQPPLTERVEEKEGER